MAVIVPTNKSVETFEGIHLYHGDISNCSMRVRMTLIEKGLPWTSHHLDLKLKENISAAYFASIERFGANPGRQTASPYRVQRYHRLSRRTLTLVRAAGNETGMLERRDRCIDHVRQ